ncbi:hypothetical protein M3Y95_00786400 [Aphelenchoides besseyi]|nr:hypothetical protein M3Y95_00786400 [Aphelenchoides besseyi]
MTTERELQARAILLEEFEKGVDQAKALKRVNNEIGPNALENHKGVVGRLMAVLSIDSLSELEVKYWYQQFKSGNTDISDGASYGDSNLIKKRLYLDSKRALFYKTSTRILKSICKVHGAENPERIICNRVVLNTIHETERKIKFVWSKFTRALVDTDVREKAEVTNLFFLDGDDVLGTMAVDAIRAGRVIMFRRVILFRGTFEFSSCVLKIARSIELGTFLDYHLLVNENGEFSLLISDNEEAMQYWTVDLSNGKLLVKKVLYLQFTLQVPTIRNNKLIGFDSSGHSADMTEVSLTDGKKTNHKIDGLNCANSIDNGYGSPYVWNKDKLFVRMDYGHEASTICEFDLSSMKWREMKMGVTDDINQMSIYGNTLVVSAIERPVDYQYSYDLRLYRFQIDKVDALSNLVWKSIQRYGQHHSQFRRWLVSKLPQKSRFRPNREEREN